MAFLGRRGTFTASTSSIVMPLFIGSEIYRHSRYGGKHPLAIPRVSLVMDLARALGWLGDDRYIECAPATPAQLARFHAPDYIEAISECERLQATTEDYRRRYGLGANGNPIFGEVFRRPATACGATLRAVELLRDGGIVHSPAGGTHHGRPSRASGFCYFNDPVLGVLGFLDQGLERIAYVDIDAHHCDGVEEALGPDPRVLLISILEAGRWPFSGPRSDPARHIHNFPVPAGFNDSELEFVLDEAVVPLIDAFAPQAIMLQAGADSLADDPMSRLQLSNLSYWRTAARLNRMSPRFLVLGGGGYNPWAVARCWTGIWATLNGFTVPDDLPLEAQAILRAVTWSHSRGRSPPAHWFATFADAKRTGPVRADVMRLAARGAKEQ